MFTKQLKCPFFFTTFLFVFKIFALNSFFFVLFSTETFSHVYHNLTGKFFYDHEISHLLWNCRSRVSIPNRVYRQLKPNWIHVCAATNLRSVSCIYTNNISDGLTRVIRHNAQHNTRAKLVWFYVQIDVMLASGFTHFDRTCLMFIGFLFVCFAR